ncbi:MAG: PaaI family thioesterase [Betaproteobacteria bacterium]|nr:PaaI family thioesterase [Betaproteobacteria bacterium]MCC6248985.1 PaaI family thioesterase [Rubrivivax sp.]MCL4698776.1 PaaI family thioesterase [Burkholderiaceae bacterium]
MPASKRKRQGPLHFPVRIPFVEELGLELWHAGDGTSELRVDLDEAHLNSWEVAHGGVLMTLLDVAMAQAARTMHRDGERFGPSVVTIEMKTTFVHPAEGLLTARGKLLHRTPTLAFCEAHVVDEKGQLCAHGTGTFKYLRALGKRRVQEVRSETRPAAAAPSNTDTDPKARP